MSDERDNPNRESKTLKAKSFFLRYFVVFMGLICLGAVLLTYKGFEEENRFLVGFGTALLSASTVGVLFKVLGYDIYITTLLREIVIDRKFLPLLKDKELWNIIKDTIEALKGPIQPRERYEVFARYIVDDLVLLSRNNRTYNIELTYDASFEPPLLRARLDLRYNVFNETKEEMPLFSLMGIEDLISRGKTTIPRSLRPSQIPEAPTDITSYDCLEIDDEEVHPETHPLTLVEWKNEDDKSEGVRHQLAFHDTIKPGRSKTVRIVSTALLDTNDYILRRHMSFGNTTTVNVAKPENLDVDLDWFLTAKGKEPEAHIQRPSEGPKSYNQTVEGVFVPGNGFVVMWWPIQAEDAV